MYFRDGNRFSLFQDEIVFAGKTGLIHHWFIQDRGLQYIGYFGQRQLAERLRGWQPRELQSTDKRKSKLLRRGATPAPQICTAFIVAIARSSVATRRDPPDP